eukprot:scaffold33516_cov59-Phaeocystis_antarctica.AAC.2
MIDCRNHIGGNCYDYIDEHGERPPRPRTPCPCPPSPARRPHSPPAHAHDAQRTAYSVQRTAYSVQRTACSVRRAAYSVQRTACSVQRTAVPQRRAAAWPRAAPTPMVAARRTVPPRPNQASAPPHPNRASARPSTDPNPNPHPQPHPHQASARPSTDPNPNPHPQPHPNQASARPSTDPNPNPHPQPNPHQASARPSIRASKYGAHLFHTKFERVWYATQDSNPSDHQTLTAPPPDYQTVRPQTIGTRLLLTRLSLASDRGYVQHPNPHPHPHPHPHPDQGLRAAVLAVDPLRPPRQGPRAGQGRCEAASAHPAHARDGRHMLLEPWP